MIRNLVLGAVIASAALAAPAHATLVSFTGTDTGTKTASPTIGSTISDSFSNSNINAGSFTDTLVFTTGLPGSTSVGLLVSAFKANFSSFSATLNGQSLTVASGGSSKFYSIDVASLAAGTQTLVISGIAKKGAGYVGSISAPVPEPSSWALSILGIGMIGGMLRARRRETGRLALA